MRKTRAKYDPVLSLVIEHMTNELEYHGRVRISPAIKKLDLNAHKDFIRENLHIVRAVLEDIFGPLTAFGVDGGPAGKGHGNKTAGYVRPVASYADLVDESLEMKRQKANGIAGIHNVVGGIIGDAVGEGRPTLTVVTALPEPEERLQITKQPEKPKLSDEAMRAARAALAEMFGGINEKG